MRRTLLYVLAGIFICHSASAQMPAKTAASAAKALGAAAGKNAAASTEAVAGAKTALAVGSAASRQITAARVPAASHQMPARAGAVSSEGVVNASVLERTIARQTAAAKSARLSSVKSIRQQVADGKNSPALIEQILQVPAAAVRADLLQDEFLTLTLLKGVRPSSSQAGRALVTFRLDLMGRIQTLKKSAEISQKNLAAFSAQAQIEAARAVADISAVGFYGTAKDAPLILDFYQACAAGALEPVAFTASARALLALKAYRPLQELLQAARPSYAQQQFAAFAASQQVPVAVPLAKQPAVKNDFSAWQKNFTQTSRAAAMHLDASAEATQKWLALKPQAAPEAQKLKQGAPARAAAAQKSLQQAVPAKPEVAPVRAPVEAEVAPTRPVSERTEAVSPQDNSGVLYAGLPVMEWGKRIKNFFSSSKNQSAQTVVKPENGEYNPVVPVLETMPRTGLISKEYPSGLKDEEGIIRDWLEYFKNGYFRPRDQVEAIEGMSAAKANNVMEYLYYMPLEEAERVILNPIRETGRLPDFMYDDRLIAGTKRLPAGYYKNKFNENVKRFVQLAEEDGSIYTHNVELKDLASTMADYSFKQGFRYQNDPHMTAGLRHNWRELVNEIRKPGLKADRTLINQLWRKPVELMDGTSVSLKDYFTQTRPTAFFKEGRMPEFFLNSAKWVALENERRNLAAAEYFDQAAAKGGSWWEKWQDWLVLGKRNAYLTLDQFGEVMTTQYRQSFGMPVRTNEAEYVAGVSPSLLEDATPSSLKVKINNFDKIGGVCQMSFTDGGYAGRVREGYDGTSVMNRFEPVDFDHVKAVTFDVKTLAPEVVTLKSVPYLKDLKDPDLDQVRAGTMVSDGLDPTRDLIGVQQAEAALNKIPHLKATIYPHARLAGYESTRPAYLDGGGLGGYLALFTPPFYPIKTVYRLRFKGMKPYVEKEYFIRKEVSALAGLVHRDRLTFTQQVEERIEKKEAAPGQTPSTTQPQQPKAEPEK